MKSSRSSHPRVLLVIIAIAIGIGGSILHRQAPPALSESGRKFIQTTPARTSAVVIREFSDWLEKSSRSAPAERAELPLKILELARERRVVMESLIRSNPEEALANAVTLDVWKSLPLELQAEVEEPFSAMGNFQVMPVCINKSPDAAKLMMSGAEIPTAVRSLEIAGEEPLASYVFGKRKGLSSKENTPIQGIRLGGRAALREGVFHELTPNEIPVAEATYPLANPNADLDFFTGEPLGPQPITALAGPKIFKFANRDNLKIAETEIAKLDEKPGPHGGSGLLFQAFASGESGGFNLQQAVMSNNLAASAWTETKKKLYMIRVDFSDKPSSSFSVVAQQLYADFLNGVVSKDIRDFSYEKTWIEATVSPAVIRLPQPSTYYSAVQADGSSRHNELLNHAKAALLLTNSQLDLLAHHIVGVWFFNIGMKIGGSPYDGLAVLGGANLWIQGTTSHSVHVHELGHNYGLGHSSYWHPSIVNINAVDPAGTNEEYGDLFDVMGSGLEILGAFHSEAKQRLNWLAPNEWTDGTASGSATHRLRRIDHAFTSGVRGLRITRGTGDYYWLSYRRLIENNWLRAGANIVWQRPNQGRSWLIDTTPGTFNGLEDRNDSSIAIGSTYSDGNIHITTLARGGVSPDEYLDIRVNLGPFPGNLPPVVNLSGPTTIGALQTATFTAQATDPNGDELAYSWDFGQGFTFDNHSTATTYWPVSGTYTVKLTVSDMKGRKTQVTQQVIVPGALSNWTTRTNSATGDFNALAASPDKVIAVGRDNPNSNGSVAVSEDGIAWTSHKMGNSPAGIYRHAQGAIWDGTQFLVAGEEYSFTAPAAWKGAIFTSPAAVAGTWTRRTLSGPLLNGIARGAGIYVAVGMGGNIVRSTNGTIWTTVTSGTTKSLKSVAYGAGKFVAVGHTGGVTGGVIVLTSSDGLTWTDTTSGVGLLSNNSDLRYVNWMNDRFIASGWYGGIRHSLNQGTSFQSIRTELEDVPALAYGNGVWFAAGSKDRTSLNIATDTGPDIDLISTDGTNWVSLVTPSVSNRNAAIFFKNTFITVGNNTSIRQSAAVLPAAIGYFGWRDTHFPDRGPLSTLNDDADVDGVANLIEYAFGNSPVSAGDKSASKPSVVPPSSGILSDRFALLVKIPDPTPAELRYTVEVADSLTGTWESLATKNGNAPWAWQKGNTSKIVVGDLSATKRSYFIGDHEPKGTAAKRFMRLRATVGQ